MHRQYYPLTCLSFWASTFFITACASDFPEVRIDGLDGAIMTDAAAGGAVSMMDTTRPGQDDMGVPRASDAQPMDEVPLDADLANMAAVQDLGLREDGGVGDTSVIDAALDAESEGPKADMLVMPDAMRIEEPPALAPVISEVQLNAGTNLTDQDGDAPPWLELFNPHDEAIDLESFRIRTDGDNPWQLPGLTMPPRSLMVVFLSGKDRGDNIDDVHAAFRVEPNATTLRLEDESGAVRQTVDVPQPTNDWQSWGVMMARETIALVDRETNYRWRAIDGPIVDGWYDSGDVFEDGRWQNHQGGLGIDGRIDAAGDELVYRVVGDSEREFSGQQGYQHWSYGSFRYRTDKDYRAADFSAFPNEPVLFGDRNYFDIDQERWRWGNRQPALSLIVDSAAMAPSSTIDGQARGVVRRWTSPVAGRVKMTGTVNRPAQVGDGTAVGIYVNGERQWSAILDANQSFTEFDIDVSVGRGEYVDFVVDPRDETDANGDLVNFVAIINLREVPEYPGDVVTDSTQHWSIDGEIQVQNWHFGYVQTDDDEYVYDRAAFTEFSRGQDGREDNYNPSVRGFDWRHREDEGLAMDRWHVRPVKAGGTAYLPVRRWRSTTVGPHHLRWAATKTAMSGDGLTIRIFLNGVLKVAEVVPGRAGETVYGDVRLDNLEPDDQLDVVVDPRGANGDTATGDKLALQVQVHTLESLDQFILPRDRMAQIDLIGAVGRSGERGVFLRIPYDASDVPTLYGGELEIRADDGFEARLNGQVVGHFGLSKRQPTQAIVNKPRRWSPSAVRFAIENPVNLENPSRNLLIVRVHDHPAVDEQFLAFARLNGHTARAEIESNGMLGTPSPGRPNWGDSSLDAGPHIIPETEWVADARRNADIDVEATIVPRGTEVDHASLVVTVGFGAPMAIEMTRVDGVDNRYRGSIPSRFVRDGTLLRWSIAASDTDGRRTVFPPLDRSHLGTVPGFPPRDNFHTPVVFERTPAHFDSEGASQAVFWIGGRIVPDGWLIKQTVVGQTKPEIALLAPSIEMQLGLTDPISSNLIDLRAPVQDDAGIRALVFNQLERALLGSGTMLKMSFLYRGAELFGVYQLGLRFGWSDTTHLGLNTDPSLFAFLPPQNETNAQIRQTGPSIGLVNAEAAQAPLARLLDALENPADLQNKNYLLTHVDRYHLINHLALRFLFRAPPCCGPVVHLGFNHVAGTWRLFPGPIDLSLGLFPLSPLGEELRLSEHGLIGHDDEQLVNTLLAMPDFRTLVERRIRTLFDQYYLDQPIGRVGDTLSDRVEDFIAYEAFMTMDRERWPDYDLETTYRTALNQIERGAQSLLETIEDWILDRVAFIRPIPSIILPQAEGMLTYRFLAPANDALGDDWLAPDFEADNWRPGLETIGENDGSLDDDITTLGSPNEGGSSIWIRYPFEVDDPSRFVELDMKARFKDGFVAFLNGVEIARKHYEGEVTWDREATESVFSNDAHTAKTIDLDETVLQHLRAGTNILAVAVFKASTDERGLLFDVTLEAEVRPTNVTSIPPPQEDEQVNVFQIVASNGDDESGFIILENEEDIAIDISNWRLTGDDFEYRLPAGAVLLPRERIYIAESPTRLRRALNLETHQIIDGLGPEGVPEIEMTLNAP
ncbi:MAG: hypothetical protein VX589_12820 [Myxococcota bacterium]|nr:hypothetical protein [Myxococcota bacterium]